ncbi:hypothetical protein VQ056_07100 [Paenibacillus sp. JTLBN-2024]
MLDTLRDVLSMPATIVVNGLRRPGATCPICWNRPEGAELPHLYVRQPAAEAGAVLEKANVEVEFPFELEQEFTHTLNLGLEKEAEDILIRFVEALQK